MVQLWSNNSVGDGANVLKVGQSAQIMAMLQKLTAPLPFKNLNNRVQY
jgi:hypothetical protein